MRKLKNLAKVLIFLLLLIFVGYFCYTCGRVNEKDIEKDNEIELYALHSYCDNPRIYCNGGVCVS